LGPLGSVSPSLIGAVGAAILSLGANQICKNRIEAAKKRDHRNAEVHKAALEIQPSAKNVHKNIYQFASKAHPNDPVLAGLAEQSPEKGFCAKYCCCCSGRKQKTPAVKNEEQIEIVIAEEAILKSPDRQLPGLHSPDLHSPDIHSPDLQSHISPSPNSPSSGHPFLEPQSEERLIIE
jgi:hypothetical protein